jgi:hypothetical protein
MEWTFIIPLVVSVIGVWLQYKEYRLAVLTADRTPEAGHSTGLAILKRQWPLTTMMLLTIICWIPYFLRTPTRQPILLSWGLQQPNNLCVATVNGAALIDNATTNNVLLICGVAVTGVDFMTDTVIAVGTPRTIVPASFQVDAQMTDAITRRVLSFSGTPTGPVPPGKIVKSIVTAWFRIALLPRGVNATQVHSLDELSRLGGVLVEGGAGDQTGTDYILPMN